MSTVEFDSARLAKFREAIKDVAQRQPETAFGFAWQKEVTKLVHMNDRQLWATIKMHSFLSWIEYEAREHIRRDRMTPVRTNADDSDEAEAV